LRVVRVAGEAVRQSVDPRRVRTHHLVPARRYPLRTTCLVVQILRVRHGVSRVVCRYQCGRHVHRCPSLCRNVSGGHFIPTTTRPAARVPPVSPLCAPCSATLGRGHPGLVQRVRRLGGTSDMTGPESSSTAVSSTVASPVDGVDLPSSESWTYAETFTTEPPALQRARARGRELRAQPISPGAGAALR